MIEQAVDAYFASNAPHHLYYFLEKLDDAQIAEVYRRINQREREEVRGIVHG